MKDRPTGIRLDLNLSSEKGVKNCEFLKFLKNYDRRCEHLVKPVKYFAVKHRIIRTGSLPHFNSYTIVLMVVFFLQSKDILPSVASLQQDVPEQICEGCNFAFDKERRSCGENHPELSISQLLLEFFQFYIRFVFSQDMVSPLTGTTARKIQMFRNDDVVVQDPFEVGRNVAGNVNQINMAHILSAFKHGVNVLKDITDSR